MYGQLGLSKNYLTLKGDTSKSSYEGWGPEAEAGVDWLWDGEFGMNLAAQYSKADLNNRGNNSSQMESGDSSSYGVKVGLYFGGLTFGGGYRKMKVTTSALSSVNGSSNHSVEGDEKFAFVNLTFNIAKKFRSTVEVSAGSGEASSLKSQSAVITLRIGLVEPFN